ncbi:hypothetical protein QFC20_006653 [Naganishia adeliensis]|uniref:Uncharacterized protein n=1 Tax=Naganishia adeliensis TaxID=92952 RepID=A0ACC2V932_9TREE|nr:hypothetical protein QFC20_006653 [Naganishia adeliensis]
MIKFSDAASRILTVLLIFANGGLGQQDAWHMDYIPTLVREVLDPIVHPNRYSNHMHRVIGGNNFAAYYNYDDLVESSCTSVELQADKSNYWMPQLYWITKPGDASTKFLPMRTNNRFYYFLGRNDWNTPVQPFPKGLRMITGNPNAKAPASPPFLTFQCQKTPEDIYYGPNWNFDSKCNNGIKTELKFPSWQVPERCPGAMSRWDGINLYKPDQSHMNFPSNPPNAGRCPRSHPIRLPMILLEYTWMIPKIGKDQIIKGHLAWANGDTTGYGMHADFVNGPLADFKHLSSTYYRWDIPILKAALNDPRCVTRSSSMPFKQCAAFAGMFDAAKAKACTPSKGVVKEPMGNEDEVEIPRLPGCNPLWGADGPKPTCNPPIPEPDVSAFKGEEGPLMVDRADQFNPNLASVGSAWAQAGCYEDSQKAVPFGGGIQVYYDNKNLSVKQCTTLCGKSNKKVAAMMKRGTNWASAMLIQHALQAKPCPPIGMPMRRCYCPYSPRLSGFMSSQMSCQICGNDFNWVVYYTNKPEVGGVGCYRPPADTNAESLTKAATHSFTSGTMTRDVCVTTCAAKGALWAGLQNGNTSPCEEVQDA